MQSRLFLLLLSLFVQPIASGAAEPQVTTGQLPLSGSPAGKDPGTWQATANLKHVSASKGNGITVINGGSFMGRLAVPDAAQVITAEAVLRPTAGGWVAVGIGSPSLGTPPWGHGVYVIVNAGGTYTLAGNDDPADWESKKMVQLKNGVLPDFLPFQPVKLKIEYNRTAKTVTVWAGWSKLVDALNLAEKGFVVEPAFAGFSGYGQAAGNVIVDDFSLSVTSAEATVARSVASFLRPATVPAWWHVGDLVRFEVIDGRLPAALVSLKVVVTDVSGREITRNQITRTDISTHGWIWTPPDPGFYEVTFTQVDAQGREAVLDDSFSLRAPNGATRSFEHTKQGFAVLPPASPAEGIVGQFGFTYTLNQQNIPLAKLVGFDLANIHPIPWGASFTNLKMAIEPTKGEYHWEILDPHVDALTAAGIEIAGQFCYTPLWASPHPEKTNVNICVVEATAYAPKDIDDYSHFVEATVTRYKDRIRLWELWNEPAVPGGSVFWSDTPENFVRLIEAGYKTVKRIQPDAEVWLGGLGGRAAYYSFYNRILALGASPFFDTLSVHGRIGNVDEFRRLEALHSVAPKPAVVSEWHAILQGNSQSSLPLDEDALSFRMIRELLLQLKAGVQRTILFEMSNLVEKEALVFASDNKWFVHSSGLFRSRPQPEPRHAAVVMANFLDASGKKAVFQKEFSPSPGVFALSLDTGRGRLVILWSESRAFSASEIAAFATPASLLCDWEGKPTSPHGGTLLPANRFYYLSAPALDAIAAAPGTNLVVSPEVITKTSGNTSRATYQDGPLFDTTGSPLAVPADLWIAKDWSHTRQDKTTPASALAARAAIGAHETGLDIVVEVNDPKHFQNEPPPTAWQGDSLQIAIDSEGAGLVGGHTELLAALSPQGPVLWKLTAADTRGDIPAQWSPAKGPVKNATVRISRDGSVTRYQIRLAWAELYPLAYDNSKPLHLSLVVNNNDGVGRTEYLEWGGGIASDKDPSAYGLLKPATHRTR
jgi:hypothetical protein